MMNSKLSPTRLRQIALVAEDIDKATHILTTVIGAEVIFEDPAVAQWGLRNILVPFGGDFIEVVSPFKSDTPASRHLSRRGDGGYMIIMQTIDAQARRRYIEMNKLAKVIFAHESKDSVCIQYHPKGIKGGMIPELDSHHVSEAHPDPVHEQFSHWHAAGPPESYAAYSAAMKRNAHLRIISATLRLAPGDTNIDAALQQWSMAFGVAFDDDNSELELTNARIRFIPGEHGKNEGLAEVEIRVDGGNNVDAILRRAENEGLTLDGNCIQMLGFKWRFTLAERMWQPKSYL